MGQVEIEAALMATNQARCCPPLPVGEVRAIAASVMRYAPASGGDTNTGNNVRVCIYERDKTPASTERDKTVTDSVTTPHAEEESEVSRFEGLSDRVLAWVKATSGWWATEELDRDLGITSPKDKDNRRQVLHRFKEQGLIEQHPKVNKQWRYVNKRVTRLDFKAAPTAGILPVRWPLEIERHVHLFPGNIVVVAGAKNAGKTAFVLNFIRLNMDQFPTYYWCSEMSREELGYRLGLFPDISIDDWHFEALERASDFEDVIVPDCINVVDYLEMTDELYRVNTHLTNISHKIGTGLAIVAIQKKEGAKYGRGQEFSAEKPKLYLSMDEGRISIVKGKSWAQRNLNPNGLRASFTIADGCRFEMTKPWGASREG